MVRIRNRKILLASVLVVLILGSLVVLFYAHKHATKQTPVTQAPNNQSASVQNQTPQVTQPEQQVPMPSTQWPVQITPTDAASLTVVVNKKHQLPSTYVPSNLTPFGSGKVRAETATALAELFTDAQAQNYNLKIISGYRSYSDQKAVYTSYVNRDGQAAADTYSARPGFSEHQTGLAVDVGTGTCDLDTCFGSTSAGKWIAANAQNYGFIVRYPQGKESDTGYQYEPWHLRYLGIDTAKSVYASGKTLDQYYNVPAGSYE